MAEGEQSIGNLVAGVVLDFSGAREQLADFKGEVDQGLKGSGKAGTPGKTATTGGVPAASATAGLKLNGKDIVAQIDTALKSHEFKLLIDQGFIREQITNALKGFEIPLGLAPGQVTARHAAPEQVGLPEEITKALTGGTKGLSAAIEEFHEAVDAASKGAGKGSIGGTTPADKLVKAIAAFGGNFTGVTSGLSASQGAAANKAVVESVGKVAAQLGLKDRESAALVAVRANQLRVAAATVPLISAVEKFVSQPRPAASAAPAPVDHEAIAAATRQRVAEQVQDRLDKATAAATSNLAPVHIGRSVNIGDLARQARTAAATTGPSAAALVAAGLATEGGFGDLRRFKGAVQLLPPGAGGGQNETSGFGDLLSRRRPRSGRGQTDAFGRRVPEVSTGTAGPAVYSFRPNGAMTIQHPDAGPMSSNLPKTGEDPAADIRANEQLGLRTDRGLIAFSKLRAGTGPADVDLRSLAALAAQGRLSNIVRNPKTGDFTRLMPSGDVGTQERFESEDRIRGFMRLRKASVPGIEGQVNPQSPSQIISAVAQELYGDPGKQFLATPRVQAELKKAIRQGGALKTEGGIRSGDFAQIGTASPSSIVGGAQDEAALAEKLRVEIYKSLPGWMGRRARQQITKEVLPQRIAEVMRTAAAARSADSAENRARIESSEGLTPQEAAEKERKALLPLHVRSQIEAGNLPDFRTIPAALQAEIESGNFTGGAKGHASRRLRDISKLLLKGGGADITAEEVSKTLGIPVTGEQAALFQEPLPNAKRIKQSISDVFGSFVTGIEPGPQRSFLTGHGRLVTGRSTEPRTSSGVSFARQDADRADALTGRGTLARMEAVPGVIVRGEGGMNARSELRQRSRPTTDLDLRLSALKKDQEAEARAIAHQDFLESEARRKMMGFTRVQQTHGGTTKKEAEGISGIADPQEESDFLFQIARSGQRKIKSGVLSRTSQAMGPRPGGTVAEIEQVQREADAILRGYAGLPTQTPGVQEEIAQRLAGGDLRTSKRSVKYATGDALRRAAAKTATVAGDIAPEETVPRFGDVNALFGRSVSGRGIVPPGGAPPAPPGGLPEVSGAIHVIVDNVPLQVTMEGGVPTGRGGATAETARIAATSRNRLNAADLRSQTSPSVQRFIQSEADRLRTAGVSEAKIKAAARAAGFGPAAEAFLGGEEPVGAAEARGRAATNRAANVLNRAGALPPLLATRLATPDVTRQEAPIDDRVARLKGQENVARTFLTQRNIGTTLTVLGESLLGGRGAPLARFAAASNRVADLANISGRRQQAEGVANTQSDLITAYKQTIAEYTAQGKSTTKLTKALAPLEEAYKVQKTVVENLKGVEDKVATEAEAAVKGVVTAKDVLRNLAGGVAGGALGVAAGIGVATVAQSAIQGVIEAVSPALDRAIGSPSVAIALTKSIATAGAPGTFAAATAQLAAQAGTGPGGLQGLTQRGEAIAGNAALIQQFDLLRGELNVEQGNRGLPAGVDRSVIQATGGLFGSGIGVTGLGDFQLSAQQAIAQAINPAPQPISASGIAVNRFGGGVSTPGALASTAGLASKALADFNKHIIDGGSKFQFSISKDTEAVNKFADSVRNAGAPELADAIKAQKLVLTGGAPTGANALAAVSAAQRASAGFDVESLLAASEPARRAQEGLRQQRIALTQNQVLPGQFGISGALAPLPTGEQAQGLLPGRDVSGIQKSFADVTKSISDAVQGAKDFVSTNLPGYGQKFSDSLDAAAADAKQISSIQIGVQIEQAQLSADKYAYSLVQANRSLADAKGLTGDITKQNGENLGIIERQQFLLGREAQSLSIYLSQLQINFQKSLAGFVSAGTTPEERAARIKEAEKEAKIAQQQLDIQKKQFALGPLQFKITSSRQLQDILHQVSFLQRDYKLSLDTKAAELQVQALSKQLDYEASKANALFGEAVSKVNDVYTAEANLVAATGKGLAEVSKMTLTAFANSYNQMALEIGTGLSHISLGNISGNSGPYTGHASGAVGIASGATNMTIGEAGNEAYAILKNPKSMIMPMGGGQPVVINITVSGNKFSTEEDERRLVATLTTEVQRQMGRNAALLGLRRPI